MQPAEIQTLYEYACWATGMLLDKSEALTTEQFEAPNGYSWGSIRGTFAHILSAQDVWQQRMVHGVSPTSLRDFSEVQTIAEFRTAYAGMEHDWRVFLADLSKERLAADVFWKNTRGKEASLPLWQVLTHVVNHSTQHNAELAQMLTEAGHSPGDIDLLYWSVRQKRAASGG
jgi:uncharacterized damage-inducible protein DinB